ncbi:MAG: hypothetical protein MI892_15775 [Desulfobacterales bacterium]|nr:hypothetical protein [Desulfobacterales bacterium]
MMKGKSKLLVFCVGFLIMLFSLPAFADDEGFTSKDESGNDPREFSSKFMPYYRYTDIKDGPDINEFVLFGFHAFDPRFGLTYEVPVAKEVDAGAPVGSKNGMGDTILRFFTRPIWGEASYGRDGSKNFSFMPMVETTLPTASSSQFDILGGDKWILSPGFVTVFDIPAYSPPFSLAFIAMMNFFDFDVTKDDGASSTTSFRGRWFYMQPFSMPKPDFSMKHLFDTSGLYIMTEFQPVYDFMESDFSLWVAPEFGKILGGGVILYAKPGTTIDKDPGDRDFTFEFGLRYFIK